MFDHFATSWWFTAFGLAVGLMSLWFYRYFTARLHTFDIEMENASLDLLNRLSRIPGPFTSGPTGLMFGEKPAEQLRRDEKFLRRCLYLAGSAMALAWFAQASRYFLAEALPFFEALRAPWFYVPFTFGLSCLPAYLVWVKLLRRRPGGMVALASIICACWSIAELLMGQHLP